MNTALEKIKKFFTRDIWALDPAALGRPRAALVRAARLLSILMRELTAGQINFRAMSLVYTTLLSIVPLIAVSFSALKAFGVHNQAEPYLAQFLAPLGPSGEEITSRIIGFVERMRVGVLGAVGLAMLLYTVISLVAKMEESLNYIWRAKRPRRFAQRFSDYMSVLLVGPILIFAALGLTAMVQSSAVVKAILSFGPTGFVFYLIGLVLPYLTTCAAFTFAYFFLPSTKVKLRAALAGGVFAGVLWEVSGWAFATFVVSSGQYSAIYSGFAILIFFMMWLYLSWLIFMVGASVSYYVQHPHQLAPEREAALSGRQRERLAFAVMYLVGDSFYREKPLWSADSLARRLHVPADPVQDVVAALEEDGLLLNTGGEPPAYVPARDMETIYLHEILVSVRAAGEGRRRGRAMPSLPEVDAVLKLVEEKAAEELKGRTLKDLVLSEKRKINNT